MTRLENIKREEEYMLSIETPIYNHSIKSSTTIPKGSTSQANGGGSGSHLTGNAEGEDIVSTSPVTQRSS